MKYVIGIDFGTLSARAVVVEAESGKEVMQHTSEYAHAVLERNLPSGKDLILGTALQVPSDYLASLSESIRTAISKAGISPTDVIAMGIDFTASTMLPIDENGTPLCEKEEFVDEPYAYVKLWKHRTATAEADEITTTAHRMGEPFIKAAGGKVSAELMLPKVLETLRRAPHVYDAAHRFVEAADWISLVLTGKETRSPVFAGYKAGWSADRGYPSNEFFKALDPRLDGFIGTKIPKSVEPTIAAAAGRLTKKGSEITGLCEGTVVALPMIDAHASLAGLGVCNGGDMVMIIGTSTCHILNSTERTDIEGIFGYVKDGVFPGLYTYESGQSAVGDSFDWFVKNALPASYDNEAKERNLSTHQLLTEKAEKLGIGESGLVALDWWSGNRSILADSSLKGMIYGLTLRTRPEEIYRALLESTVFGARVIIEQHEKFGVEINSVTAAGGIANKNALLMQIFADVLDRDIKIASSTQSGALGSAVYAAAAAGIYGSVEEASKAFAKPCEKVYHPIKENTEAYDVLYKKYRTLHDYFAKNKI